MLLPKLQNRSRSTAALFPTLAGDGWAVLLVIKQRFHVGEAVDPVPGAELRLGDVPWADALGTSVRYPHDLAPTKPTTDVLVVGDAMTPGGALERELAVRAEVADAALSARVLGPRTWCDVGRGIVPTAPLPFARAPLRWECAFGGIDGSDPDHCIEEPRNPIGGGLVRDPRQLIGTSAPHVEDPADPIVDHRSRPAPVGFGPLGPGFEPRRSAAGTYDESWTRTRMPLPPVGQSETFHQVAAPSLRTTEHLRGGEPVRLLGMHPSGLVAFDLPELWYLIDAPDGRGRAELIPVLDTVLLEPNDLRLELTWRAQIPWVYRGRSGAVRLSQLGGAR